METKTTIFEKIGNFFKKLFNRSDRIDLALKVTKALKSFSDTAADDIIIYVLNVVAPATSTATTLVKNFLDNDLPILLQALELMDVSDNNANTETNKEAVVMAAKKIGECDDKALYSLVEKAFKDKKLSLSEAKEIIETFKN